MTRDCNFQLILAGFDKEQDPLNFLNFLNNRHPNIKFTIEKQINHSIAFLDVFISGLNNQNLTLQTYHKLTYTGFLLNFKVFTSFLYKINLIKCLIDRSFKTSICSNAKFFFFVFFFGSLILIQSEFHLPVAVAESYQCTQYGREVVDWSFGNFNYDTPPSLSDCFWKNPTSPVNYYPLFTFTFYNIYIS